MTVLPSTVTTFATARPITHERPETGRGRDVLRTANCWQRASFSENEADARRKDCDGLMAASKIASIAPIIARLGLAVTG